MTIAQGQIGLLADYATSIVKRVDIGLCSLCYFFYFRTSLFAFHTSISTSFHGFLVLCWQCNGFLCGIEYHMTACCNSMQGLFC